VLRQKWSRGQVEARFANMPPCLIGMEACVGAHHLSRGLWTKDFHHMISLIAIIRCKPGSEEHIRKALLDVGRYASTSEPGTRAYFITAGMDQGVFVTHERYADEGALDAHNEGSGAEAFFAAADGHLEAIEIQVGTEIFPED
jgi:quinol monooxygenase YgiN